MHIKKKKKKKKGSLCRFQSLYRWLGVIFGSPGRHQAPHLGLPAVLCPCVAQGAHKTLWSTAPRPSSSLTDGQLQGTQQRTLRSSGMAEPQKRKVLGPRLNCIDENCPLTRNTCWNFVRMKEKLLLCLFVEAVGLSDYYTCHCSLSSLENVLELERQSE